MSQQFLDVAQVYAALKQVGGEAMAQGVEGGRLCDAGFFLCPFERLLDGAFAEVFALTCTWEEPTFRAVQAPVVPEKGEGIFGQEGVAVFTSFAASHTDEHAVAFDVLGAKANGLTSPQPAGVD